MATPTEQEGERPLSDSTKTLFSNPHGIPNSEGQRTAGQWVTAGYSNTASAEQAGCGTQKRRRGEQVEGGARDGLVGGLVPIELTKRKMCEKGGRNRRVIKDLEDQSDDAAAMDGFTRTNYTRLQNENFNVLGIQV